MLLEEAACMLPHSHHRIEASHKRTLSFSEEISPEIISPLTCGDFGGRRGEDDEKLLLRHAHSNTTFTLD